MEHISKWLTQRKIKDRARAFSYHNLGTAQTTGKGGRFYIHNDFVLLMIKALKQAYGLAIASHICRIYMVLVKHIDKTGTCFPSHKRIMDLGCISNKNTLIKALKIMENLKLVIREPGRGRNRPTIYLITKRERWIFPSDLPPENVSKPP